MIKKIQISKFNLLKQFGILNMVAGVCVSFILITMIMAKFILTGAFTIALLLVSTAINKKTKVIMDRFDM